MKRMKQTCLTIALTAVLAAVSVLPASAASLTSRQKKTVKATDPFVTAILYEVGANNRYDCSHSAFIRQTKAYYNGKLGEKQKSAIAALNTAPYDYEEGIGICRRSSVKATYKDLFGKTPSDITLPSVTDKFNGEYYLWCARSGSAIYINCYEKELDTVFSRRRVSKSGNTYTVTEKVKYWHYWGWRSQGEAEDQTITVTIKLRRNTSSPYGYRITGLKIS